MKQERKLALNWTKQIQFSKKNSLSLQMMAKEENKKSKISMK